MNGTNEQSIAQQEVKSPSLVDKNVVSKPDVKLNEFPSFNSINLFDEKQLAAAENFLTKVMRSEKGGIKSVNDGLAVLMRAQDLNLPFSTCLEHIHVINGKTGVDIHIVKALLLRAGVTWECIDDYTPLYEFTDSINVYVDGDLPDYVVKCKSAKDAEEKSTNDPDKVYIYPVKFYKDFKGNIYRDYQVNPKAFGIAVNMQQVASISKENKIPIVRIPSQPVNYMTRYKLKRIVNNTLVESIGKFTYRDAEQAGMFEKDTYKKYPKVLIGHRAFTLAARDIASDVLFGVMETKELKITMGSEISNEQFIDDQDVL